MNWMLGNFVIFLALVIGDLSSNTLPKLVIKIPTRERPRIFFACLDRYYELLSNRNRVFFLITCDTDDLSMNCAAVRSRLAGYSGLSVVYGPRVSKIEAYNRDIGCVEDFDLLLLASDDTWPLVKGYDDIIIQAVLKRAPDFDCVVKFGDGRSKSYLNPFPVFGKKFYQRFGYFYQPDYKSLFCDLELTYVSKLLGKELAIEQDLIRHDHPLCNGIPCDDLFRKNLSFQEVDRNLFVRRAAKRFELAVVDEEQWNWVKSELEKWDLITPELKTNLWRINGKSGT